MGGNHPDVVTPVENAALDLVDRVHPQFDGDIGCQSTQFADRSRDPRFRVGRRLVEQRQLQGATQALVQVIDLAAQIRDRAEHPQRGLVDLRTLGGQCKAAAPASAQAHAESCLEILDVAADGRATDIELQFGRREAATFDHGPKHPQQSQVEVAHLGQYRSLHRMYRRFSILFTSPQPPRIFIRYEILKSFIYRQLKLQKYVFMKLKARPKLMF